MPARHESYAMNKAVFAGAGELHFGDDGKMTALITHRKKFQTPNFEILSLPAIALAKAGCAILLKWQIFGYLVIIVYFVFIVKPHPASMKDRCPNRKQKPKIDGFIFLG